MTGLIYCIFVKLTYWLACFTDQVGQCQFHYEESSNVGLQLYSVSYIMKKALMLGSSCTVSVSL